LGRKEIALVLASTVLALGGAELTARELARHIGTVQQDKLLGWRTVPYRVRERNIGEWGFVHYETGWEGFRRVGNWKRGAPRILFIGDSFTQAVSVSNGDTYYDQIARAIPEAEVFAYGAGGYGTLQELLVLDKYFEQIRPNVVVLQFCGTNDFVNNDFRLDRASFPNNNFIRRPYLENGRVVYRFPGSWYGRFKLADLVRRVVKSTRHPVPGGNIDLSFDQADRDRMIAVTTDLLRMVRKRTAEGRVIVFAADEVPSLQGVVAHIAQTAGVGYVGTVPAAIIAAATRGEHVYVSLADTHWSRLGHRIVAAELTDPVRRALSLPAH
jgi:hypothetical protein